MNRYLQFKKWFNGMLDHFKEINNYTIDYKNLEIMPENQNTKAYIIIFLLAMGLLSSLTSCSSKVDPNRYSSCYYSK